MDPKSTKCPYKIRTAKYLRHKSTGKGSCEDKAEVREMCLQGKEHQGLFAPPEAGGGRKDPFLKPSEGTSSCQHLDLTSWPPEL